MVGWTRWTESHGRLKLGHLSDPQHVRLVQRQERGVAGPSPSGQVAGDMRIREHVILVGRPVPRAPVSSFVEHHSEEAEVAVLCPANGPAHRFIVARCSLLIALLGAGSPIAHWCTEPSWRAA